MRTYLQRLDEMGFWLGRPERLVVFAEACLHGGHRCEGADAVREGLHIVDESGDSRMAPELWRLRAELCTAPEERRDCLARALRCAIDQGGEWWALRAATAIVQDGDSSPAHAQAQATLKGFLARLSKREAELEDVRRARSALDATQRDITT
jgi:hypothetical protein